MPFEKELFPRVDDRGALAFGSHIPDAINPRASDSPTIRHSNAQISIDCPLRAGNRYSASGVHQTTGAGYDEIKTYTFHGAG